MPEVVDGALWLLSRVPHLKFPLVTTGVSVEARLLARIADMLEAPNTAEWRYLVIFQILSHLALHEASAVVIVEANILNNVKKILRSRPTNLYDHIFSMLERLVSHKSTVIRMIPYDLLGCKIVDDTAPIDELATWWKDLVTAKLLDSPHKASVETTCGSLVAFVCDMPEVVYGALWALSRVPHLKFPPVMTGLSVEARLLARFADMLEATNASEGHYPLIFEILSHLALHESSAVAIVETNILKSIQNLPRSSCIHLHWDIYTMLRNLVSHESTATTVLDMCRLLATLWRENLDADMYTAKVGIRCHQLEVNCQIHVTGNWIPRSPKLDSS
ncbi:hypothetical protein C8J57DRAFT_1224160 [Mycena rebaudengoi]|nr:hypothetical protein C8J57DRAFT_1224160 [Mycena rebaudengoi]